MICLYRITNISGQVVSLIDENLLNPMINLFSGETLEVRVCSKQLYRLCDPARAILDIKEVKDG